MRIELLRSTGHAVGIVARPLPMDLSVDVDGDVLRRPLISQDSQGKAKHEGAGLVVERGKRRLIALGRARHEGRPR